MHVFEGICFYCTLFYLTPIIKTRFSLQQGFSGSQNSGLQTTMWGTSTHVFAFLKTTIYPFLVFDLAYSYLRTKRASNFYFLACSTNKLTKIRQFNSQMEQYRTLFLLSKSEDKEPNC